MQNLRQTIGLKLDQSLVQVIVKIKTFFENEIKEITSSALSDSKGLKKLNQTEKCKIL